MKFTFADLFNPRKAVEREAKKEAARLVETLRLHDDDRIAVELDVQKRLSDDDFRAGTLADQAYKLVPFVFERTKNLAASRWRKEAGE